MIERCTHICNLYYLFFYSRYTEIPTVATTTLRICFEIIGCVGAEL